MTRKLSVTVKAVMTVDAKKFFYGLVTLTTEPLNSDTLIAMLNG